MTTYLLTMLGSIFIFFLNLKSGAKQLFMMICPDQSSSSQWSNNFVEDWSYQLPNKHNVFTSSRMCSSCVCQYMCSQTGHLYDVLPPEAVAAATLSIWKYFRLSKNILFLWLRCVRIPSNIARLYGHNVINCIQQEDNRQQCHISSCSRWNRSREQQQHNENMGTFLTSSCHHNRRGGR